MLNPNLITHPDPRRVKAKVLQIGFQNRADIDYFHGLAQINQLIMFVSKSWSGIGTEPMTFGREATLPLDTKPVVHRCSEISFLESIFWLKFRHLCPMPLSATDIRWNFALGFLDWIDSGKSCGQETFPGRWGAA